LASSNWLFLGDDLTPFKGGREHQGRVTIEKKGGKEGSEGAGGSEGKGRRTEGSVVKPTCVKLNFLRSGRP